MGGESFSSARYERSHVVSDQNVHASSIGPFMGVLHGIIAHLRGEVGDSYFFNRHGDREYTFHLDNGVLASVQRRRKLYNSTFLPRIPEQELLPHQLREGC